MIYLRIGTNTLANFSDLKISCDVPNMFVPELVVPLASMKTNTAISPRVKSEDRSIPPQEQK